MTFFDTLRKALLKIDKYKDSDGGLKNWVVAGDARNFDEELLTALMKSPELKSTFFREIAGATVFDQKTFLEFLEQKNYLNDSYTQYKNKIGLTIGGKFLRQRNEVSLVWPFKDCILEGGQSKEEQKRDEIFFNEILAQDEISQLLEPKVLSAAAVYDADGKHDFKQFARDEKINKARGLSADTITDNLIIKGNNLLALHTLKKEFAGKVKLIYIDPPYNTDSDSFQYNDRFNHSSWLTFMKNRLEAAQRLLRDDGVIFVQCDDNEQAYLKVLLDEIFGRENFVSTIAVKSSTPSGTKTTHKNRTIIKQKDLILVYKNIEVITLYPQYTVRDRWDKHYTRFLRKNNSGNYSLCNLIDVLLSERIIDERIRIADIDINDKRFKQFYLANADSICRLQSHKNKEADKESRKRKDIVYEHFKKGKSQGLYYNGQVITPLSQGIKKVYKDQKIVEDLGMLLCDFWEDIDFQNTQNEGGVSLPSGKKPELLLLRLISLSTKSNDIVLDFHLGSGTTAAVAHKMGRQYIGVEQMDYIESKAVKRLCSVVDGEQGGISKAVKWQGGGSFTYFELKRYNEEFISRIEAAASTKVLLSIWEDMKARSFLNYNVDIKSQDDEIDEFKKLSLAKQKVLLCELLDKNQLYVNLSSLEDGDFACTDEEKRLTRSFYGMEDK